MDFLTMLPGAKVLQRIAIVDIAAITSYKFHISFLDIIGERNKW